MAYTIHKSDGTLISVPDNALDTTYCNGAATPPGIGIGPILVGRNAIDYGASIAQNFLQMTENFASAGTPPDSTSLQGQLWFEKSSGTAGNLYVRVSGASSGGINNWQKIVTVDSGGGSTIDGTLTVTGDGVIDGTLTVGGHNVPVVYTSTATPGQPGDIAVVGAVVSMYVGGAWQQIFPPIYS